MLQMCLCEEEERSQKAPLFEFDLFDKGKPRAGLGANCHIVDKQIAIVFIIGCSPKLESDNLP